MTPSSSKLITSRLDAMRNICIRKHRNRLVSQLKMSRSDAGQRSGRLTGMQFAVMQVLHDGSELPG